MWRLVPLVAKIRKLTRRKRAGMIQYHARSSMEPVHLDVLGPFNMSSKGNKYVLGMIDQFTKWLECVPLPHQSAEKLLYLLSTEFFVVLACPSLFIPIKVACSWEMFLKQFMNYLKFEKHASARAFPGCTPSISASTP